MITPAGPRFVAYYSVCTDKQGRSGLGLEGQRAAVACHVAFAGGGVAVAFEEVESGLRRSRPQLGLALAECRLRCAVLLIAKLDHVARDAHFLPRLRSGDAATAVGHTRLGRRPRRCHAAAARQLRSLRGCRARTIT